MLGAGLVSQLVADYLRAPRMLAPARRRRAARAVRRRTRSTYPSTRSGAQLLLTLGVSFILFHGGLQLSTRVLSGVAVGLGMLVMPGVVAHGGRHGQSSPRSCSDCRSRTGLLIGAVLAPTDPAILIPLFERIRLRPKVSQTIIAESALNDPTGAVLALAFAGVVLSGAPR